jgi:hypothetical protein
MDDTQTIENKFMLYFPKSIVFIFLSAKDVN